MKTMKESGVTLIELLVITSIISILAVALSFSYVTWMGNYRVESQTKSLYSDLMDARTRAMTRNRMYFVVINANNYALYEDSNENGAADPGAGDEPIPEFKDPATGNVKPKAVQYDLGWTGTITFDTRGLTDSTTTTTIRAVLPLPPPLLPALNPDSDCILVGQLRIRTGKWKGSSCEVR